MESTLGLAAVAVAMGLAAQRVAHWLVDRVGVVRNTLEGATADLTLSGPARLIDGDTLETRGTRVRLHGIDAPESAQRCRSGGRIWSWDRDAARRVRGARPGPLWAHGGTTCRMVAVAEPPIASQYWGQRAIVGVRNGSLTPPSGSWSRSPMSSPASPSCRTPGCVSCCPGTGKPPGTRPWPRRPVLTSRLVFEPTGSLDGPHVPPPSPGAYHLDRHPASLLFERFTAGSEPVRLPPATF